MLIHTNEKSVAPRRTVILGAGGFLGKALLASLGKLGADTLALTRADIDLTTRGAGEALSDRLEADDALVFLSALTPDKGRGPEALQKNIAMAAAVSTAIGHRPPSHLVYISSDAVYPFSAGLVSETSAAAPFDLYGVTHLAREIMMREAAGDVPVAILRPTIVFGPGDTHNSYGPNRLRRMARDTGKITLFGNGEETRDHIYINDVVSLCLQTLMYRSHGLLNLVSGESISYLDLAQIIAGNFDGSVAVEGTPRANEITHRHYDTTNLYKSFPEFKFTDFGEAIEKCHRALLDGID